MEMGTDHIGQLALEFGARAEISARTVLVTVFGDSVVPCGGEIWLGDLIALMRPFGFSDRLTRTSVSRLMGEGWFEAERKGRRSRYRLTEHARVEFAAAEKRIYHAERPDWDGRWTLVFDETARTDPEAEGLMTKHLRWHGFHEIALHVLAFPGDVRSVVGDVATGLGLETTPGVALAEFDDVAGLVESMGVDDRFGLAEADAGYVTFCNRYGSTVALATAPEAAFLLRTMIVHDLRRVRLGDPWLPEALLPPTWRGVDAYRLAAGIYRSADAAAWTWLADIAGLAPDPEMIGDRFSENGRYDNRLSNSIVSQ